MTAPDYVAKAAELLGQHAPDGTMNRLWCRCGWEADRTINGPLRRQHTAHQAEVLAAAGLIPTSVETRIDYACDDDCPGWWTVRRPEGLRRVPCEHATRRTRAVTEWKDAT